MTPPYYQFVQSLPVAMLEIGREQPNRATRRANRRKYKKNANAIAKS